MLLWRFRYRIDNYEGVLSAFMRKHLTDEVAKISWHGRRYAVLIEVMERYKLKKSVVFHYCRAKFIKIKGFLCY